MMKPGRELDALIGEKVMDGKRHLVNSVLNVDVSAKSFVFGQGWEYPRYSTDISAAWEVVEKLKVGKRTVEADSCVVRDTICIEFRDEINKWFVSWKYSGWGWKEVEHWTSGETAPHAICLAALKAVGASPA
jgi:hypothetical protein